VTRLAEIVTALERARVLVRAPERLPDITGLSADTRRLTRGMLYCALRGSTADGHAYVADAARAGAAAALVETRQASDLPQLEVRDGRRAAAIAAETWYNHPASQLELYGVTGTNGKTTSVALARHVLAAIRPTASIGTLGAFDPAGQAVPSEAGTLTTPGPIELQSTLAALLERGAEAVAMEVSSHSLDQGRVDGLTFQAAIFTNFTRDHLDYHRDMDEYFAAKARLLSYLDASGLEVVNADDPAWRRLRHEHRRITFGEREGDVRATGIRTEAHGALFGLVTPVGEVEVRFPLIGRFNVTNALGVAACAWGRGLGLDVIAGRLATAPQVPGRMERIADRPCVVLRDYAHTPDALERALGALRPLTRGRMIVVFGAGGDRDRGKRAPMGEIAVRLADLAIVTSDNPRTEEPERIVSDIVQGMNSGTFERIVDRRAAIARALELAKNGDTILLAGKGHETYQIIGTTKHPFDERQVVRELGAE
jgi:UDP-N-acetylmuramoyl-L-alanyl-D-glutamate--2,6-diaminopimelate ligase